MVPTNLLCINSNSIGYGCDALREVEEGCLDEKCPFFRTREDFITSEEYARRRCARLNIVFQSRGEVIAEMDRTATYIKTRREARKSRKRIFKYDPTDLSFTEYSSLEEACEKNGISKEKLELLIKKKEPYNGSVFVEM